MKELNEYKAEIFRRSELMLKKRKERRRLALALGTSLCAVLVVFGTPVAVNSYNMALQMDGDADLAGGIVLLTTALSCLTLFLWIWLLKTLCLL